MINKNFNVSLNFLCKINDENPTPVSIDPQEFSEEYQSQHPILTALKILNKTAIEGASHEKQELSLHKDKIVVLNKMIAREEFSKAVKEKFGQEIEASVVKGFQVALPQTGFDKMLNTATKIFRIIFTLLLDFLLLPGALVLILMAACKTNFNPKDNEVKKGEIPILLLHGSGFNETEWLVGRQFLKKEKYGSVFSLNYDGLLSNDPANGIDDYAKGEISKKIKRIIELTGQNKVILIGHSMGGMIAGFYAEHCAKVDGVTVEHVISIASPWQGTPMVDCFWKLGACFAKTKETKRHLQMSVEGGTKTQPNFRVDLVKKALQSERVGLRKYYNVWSTTDYAVPERAGTLTEHPGRERRFNFLGHYATVVWPSVWLQVRSWLDDAYLEISKASDTA